MMGFLLESTGFFSLGVIRLVGCKPGATWELSQREESIVKSQRETESQCLQGRYEILPVPKTDLLDFHLCELKNSLFW